MALGNITVETIENRKETGVQTLRYVWRPGADLQKELHAGFEMVMIGQRRSPDGPLCFIVEDKPSFFTVAAAGGRAILMHQRAWDQDARNDCRMMSLVYQQAHLYREHLTRRFLRLSDLTIGSTADGDSHELNVLPDRFGQGPDCPRGVAELIRSGSESADSGGGTVADHIRRGLWMNAKRNPIDPASMTEQQAFTTVRLGLFDLGEVATIDPASQIMVECEFMEALDKHLDLDREAFKAWFFRSVVNIVRGISKKAAVKKAVARNEVRAALLNMTLRSLQSVGECIDALMEDFLAALPEALSHKEAEVFRGLFCKQKHYGGLPLAMLSIRYNFAKEAFDDLFFHPTDPRRIGTLLRLMDDYGQMCRKRRAADCRRKARASRRGKQKQSEVEQNASMTKPFASRFQITWNDEICDELRSEFGITCSCGPEAVWDSDLANDAEAGLLMVKDKCNSCKTECQWSVSYATYLAISTEHASRA